MRSYIYSFLLLSLCCTVILAADPTVTVSQGTFVGMDMTGFSQFLGIPYAKPPIGELRFAKPQPVDNSNCTTNATELGNRCLQKGFLGFEGSEDCLNLNIYTPKIGANEKKAVMIWLHGGGYEFGHCCQYGGSELVTTGDVVIVLINFRINAFGFLSTGDSELPGNYGLWDQRMAFQWVKDNIAGFGGDPDNITLFGRATGAGSLGYHLISPQNNISLFQRVLTQSLQWTTSITRVTRDPMHTAEAFAEEVGCSVANGLLKCLRSKTGQVLVEAAEALDIRFPFYPVVDGDFLPYDLADLLNDYHTSGKDVVKDKLGDFAKYELFSGWNNQDGLLFMSYLQRAHNDSTGVDKLEGGVSVETLKAALSVFPLYKTEDNYAEDMSLELIIDYYMNSPDPMASDGRSDAERRIEVFMNIAGDAALKLPSIQLLQLHADLDEGTTYAYEFTVKNPVPGFTWYQGPFWLRQGADHVDDTPYIFGMGFVPGSFFNWSPKQVNLSIEMTTQWTDFAKTGNPGAAYEPFTTNQTYTIINLGELGEKKMMPRSAEVRLWTALDGAIINTPEPVIQPVNTTSCDSVKGEYLSGLVELTPQQASRVMTGLVVGVVIACLIVVILFISVITLKCRDDGK